jgi:hypothetical protein
LTGLAGGSACGDGVVEHHPGAPERPRQCLPLARGRVQAVGVPELHTSTVRLRTDKNGLRPGRHRVFLRHAHVVFVEFNGENNHLHLLVDFPPKLALSSGSTSSSRTVPV